MNNGTMGVDSSPATISQNKSPEAEVTEPPTGNNINLISQRYEKYIFIICLFEKMLHLCSATVLLSYSDWGFFMPDIKVLLKI